MNNQYPFSAYNKYLCLKFSIPMWLVSLFLVRPFAILIISISKKGDRTGLFESIYGGNMDTMTLEAVAALPAILVLVALAKREPDASNFMQSIWRRGRLFLFLSTLLNILSQFTPLLINSNQKIGAPQIITLIVCALILAFLGTSQRAKDTFNDFPKSGTESKR